MILKEIAHKVAQAFRLAQATDKKLSTGIAAALDAKAEQLREYEKRFEPEPPEPDPLLEARTSLAQLDADRSKPDEDAPEAGIHNQRDRREDEPVRIKYQIQTLRKGEKRWQKLRSGREAKTKPEASC